MSVEGAVLLVTAIVLSTLVASNFRLLESQYRLGACHYSLRM